MAQQRQTYHHKDLRNALIETGIQIVNTEGVNAFSLRRWLRRVVSAMLPLIAIFKIRKNCLKKCNYLSQIDFLNN